MAAFAIFGGVLLSLLYDNLKISVAKICGDGKRERTRAFSELLSHYLLEAWMGNKGKREFTQAMRLLDDREEGCHRYRHASHLPRRRRLDAVKLIALARIERRPVRLNLAPYPHFAKGGGVQGMTA